jgi:peroxiredoxin
MEKQAKTLAPGFEAKDVTGKLQNLGKIAAQRPVLMFFIQRDCPCSKEAAPFISQLAAHYRDRFTVIGVVDSSTAAGQNWLRETGAKFTLIADPKQAIIHAYKAPSSNYLTLIDKGGRIFKSYPGVGQSILRELNSRIAGQTGLSPAAAKFESAPKKPVIGCTFPVTKLDAIS